MTSAPEAHKTAGVLELKPCPFCGGEPRLFSNSVAINIWRVQCIRCDAGPSGSMGKPAAIVAWNTRSTPSVPAVHKDAGALSKFAKWAITEGPFAGGDLSGGEVQDKAVELGLLREVSYDPAEHGKSNYGLEPGDSWFVFAGPLRDGLPPPQPPGASPAGDDPKALDAAARSSSTEAVEQERPTGHFTIDHDGFAGTVIGHYTTLEGKQGVVLQQDGTRVVHVYGEKWLKPSPIPAACKPEGETSLPGKEEGCD